MFGDSSDVNGVAQEYRSEPLRSCHSIGLHHLTLRNGLFAPVSADGNGRFDPVAYSLFKYGHGAIADAYGGRIAQLILPHLQSVRSAEEEVVITGTPYRRVPNAARWLAVSAQHDIRTAGIPAVYTTIYQQHLSVGDYGRLTQQEREERNRQKRRVFDPEEFRGRHVVVIDDIRITGSITRSIGELFAEIPVLSLTFAFLVIMDPEVTQADPQVEDRLNHYAISDLGSLHRLMTETDSFSMTTRAVRFVLESRPAAVKRFVRSLDVGHLRALYYGALDDGYDRMLRYRDTFGLVRDAYEVAARAYRSDAMTVSLPDDSRRTGVKRFKGVRGRRTR